MIRDCFEKNFRRETFFWFWNRFFFLNFSLNILNRFSIIRWNLTDWNWRISKFREDKARFWCCCKSNDLNCSSNMRLKSFIVRYDFCMWNSWCFRIEVRKDESEKIIEQLTDNFFIDFDVILSVAIVKCKFLNETNRQDIFVENIWLRDVAKKIDETKCEINEEMIADFFAILYADLNAKTRKSKLLTDFRAWCWRICSWNLLLKLNIWLQCRSICCWFLRWFWFSFECKRREIRTFQ